MKRISDHIRKHLLEQAGVIDLEKRPDLEELKKTEWSPKFEKFMRNRLIMGALRYGCLQPGSKPRYNRVDSIRQRLDLYQQGGNQEHLVDIANLAMCEFLEPGHKNAHWKAEDDKIHQKEI